MFCYGGKDLARSYRTVRGNTLQIAEEIPESQLDFAPAPGTRTFRQVLTHIALLGGFAGVHVNKLTSFEGINFPELMAQMHAEEQKPRSKAELIAMLKQSGEQTAAWMETLSDDFLAENFNQPTGITPAVKSRFEMITAMKEHEMHHRGQLMLMLRIIGQVPPLTRQRQEQFAASAQRA